MPLSINDFEVLVITKDSAGVKRILAKMDRYLDEGPFEDQDGNPMPPIWVWDSFCSECFEGRRIDVLDDQVEWLVDHWNEGHPRWHGDVMSKRMFPDGAPVLEADY